ncbi:MAG TPA: outer membrane beta-barrel protein [Gammaproteobacteria bacterium]|nr:outer membrane beta-barrel protein [Gammaproteobacteria bacterium]
MNKIIKSLALCSILFPVAQSIANPYAGIEVGRGGNIKFNKMENQFESTKNTTWAARGFMGYKLTQNAPVNYGVETGFNQNEKAHALAHTSEASLNSKVKSRSVDMLAVVDMPVITKVTVFGKGGVAVVEQKTISRAKLNQAVNAPNPFLSPNIAVVENTATSHRILPKGVVGLGYQLASNQSIDLSYNYVLGKRKAAFNPETSSYKVLAQDSLNLGWSYHFA